MSRPSLKNRFFGDSHNDESELNKIIERRRGEIDKVLKVRHPNLMVFS